MQSFANIIWARLPRSLQLLFSRIFSWFFKTEFSRWIIVPFCVFFQMDDDYLSLFNSESGKTSYRSFSDFFIRKLKKPIPYSAQPIWPCEGYICDRGSFQQKKNSVVKGQPRDLNEIFLSDAPGTENHFFLNIFLHNHNYHRVHAPVSGVITSIERVPGQLLFLRPWFYKNWDRSYPAFENERVILKIQDSQSRNWWLALVGGFGVGTIELAVSLNSPVSTGQELGCFLLGSTVCLAVPEEVQVEHDLQRVMAGQVLPIRFSQPTNLLGKYRSSSI